MIDFATLGDFSGILTHSLAAEAMLRQFLLQLRDLLSGFYCEIQADFNS